MRPKPRVLLGLINCLAFLSALGSPVWCYALSVSGGLGVGQTVMSNEATESEGPLTQAWTVEQLFHSRLALGVEHLRSFKTNLTTSTSFSGLLGRYYLNAAPTKLLTAEKMGTDVIINHDLSVFVGLGFGFAQSSRLSNDVGLSSNAAGLYISPRTGVEFQLTESLGVRGEFIYAMTVVGTGRIQMTSLGSAICWIF